MSTHISGDYRHGNTRGEPWLDMNESPVENIILSDEPIEQRVVNKVRTLTAKFYKHGSNPYRLFNGYKTNIVDTKSFYLRLKGYELALSYTISQGF